MKNIQVKLKELSLNEDKTLPVLLNKCTITNIVESKFSINSSVFKCVVITNKFGIPLSKHIDGYLKVDGDHFALISHDYLGNVLGTFKVDEIHFPEPDLIDFD